MKSMQILILSFAAFFACQGNASGGATNQNEKEKETLSQAQFDQLNDLLGTARSKEKDYQTRIDAQKKDLEKIIRPYFAALEAINKKIADLPESKDKSATVKKLEAEKELLKKEYGAKRNERNNLIAEYRKLHEKAKDERIRLEQKLKGLSQQATPQAEKPKIIVEHKTKNPPIIPNHIINHIRSYSYSPEIVTQWLDEDPENKNAVLNGNSLLKLSIMGHASPQIFDELIAREVNTLTKHDDGGTALDIAMSTTRPELALKLVPLMIKQGADLDELLESANERNKFWDEALKDTVKGSFYYSPEESYYNQKVIDLINDEKKRRLEEKEEAARRNEAERVIAQGRLITPDVMATTFKELFAEPQGEQKIVHAMKKAIRTNDSKALTQLIGKNNENIELKDDNGYTPLLQAIYTNKPESVKLLLKVGANPEATIKAADDSLVNALALAKLLGYKEIEALLMDAPKSKSETVKESIKK